MQLMRRVVIQLHSPVDVSPMSDLDDCDGWFRVVDRIENPVVPLAHAVFVLPRKLFAAVRAWFATKLSDPRYQPLPILELN